MRDKIARIISNECKDEYYWMSITEAKAVAAQILTIITEEIKKVENPYPVEKASMHYHGFETCRQKIHTLLRSK